VLVGTKISPGNPVTKKDGTVVRTLWGELAYQLGGKKAFARVAKDDERASNPGDLLRELLREYGPSLVLIDEWVAYARQLHDQKGLPAGDFETHFTFAQALTESAKLVDNCLLVISLPASDVQGSPHAQADDSEVGGIRGREALDRLRNVVGRVEAAWRPASAEEGFEIVCEHLAGPSVRVETDRHREALPAMFEFDSLRGAPVGKPDPRHRTPPCVSIAHSRMASASASLSSAGSNPRARMAAMTAALSALPLLAMNRLIVPTGTPW
jgi:predicted AAA+ superfamily ATPase